MQITEGAPKEDGIIRFNQRLLLYKANAGLPFAEVAFADTHFRSKIGMKPLAVMPTGEVLAMGKLSTGANPEKKFRIQSCGYIAAELAISGSLCAGSDVIESRIADDGAEDRRERGDASNMQRRTDLPNKDTAKKIFGRIAEAHLDDFPWTVSTSELPPTCRKVAGCPIEGQQDDQAFVPLKGVRLTDGTYRQIGLPYAQTEKLTGLDRFFEAFREGKFAGALKNVVSTQADIPGNLADDMRGDVGIDCSALVQVAWNGRPPDTIDRWDTASIQNLTASKVCPARLHGPHELSSGDAIGIRVKNGAEHVVLYGAMLRFDGASEFWLVLESSSSCDGVCWSVYDPSFFNGWGLYRSNDRSDVTCEEPGPTTPLRQTRFPADIKGWQNAVLDDLPKNKTKVK